ncbi:MAG: putative nuclear protein NAP, partial [Streblomastix strix]
MEEDEQFKLDALQKIANSAPISSVLDEKSAKRYILSFEKRLSENQQVRMQDQVKTEQLIDADFGVFDAIQTLKGFSDYPQYISLLVSTQSIESIIGILDHENIDLVIAVIDLIKELTDPDLFFIEPNSILFAAELIKEKTELQLIPCLKRLDENELDEQTGILNIMGILDNLLEVNATIVEQSLSQSESNDGSIFLKWLINRISKGPYPEDQLLIDNKNLKDQNKD